GRFAELTNRFQVWYRLPFLLAMPTIVGHRVNMREQNLSDTERDPSLLAPRPGANGHDQREADGSYNDLGCPWMGMAGARFGRNVPIGDTHGELPPELYEPNPRQVSRDLLARRSFVPVPHLNVLVPAWLQFMVHDWLSHGGGDTKTPPHRLPLPSGDDWPSPDMTILRTLPDDRRCPADQGQPATYRNTETHWWDGSQLYGSDLGRQQVVRTDPASGQLRADGKIHLDTQGHLPVDQSSEIANLELSGVNGNWWVGLSVLHTLFAREHNAIVDRLRVDYPTADGEWLFQKARLVNAALIAKIHTVEWTPALMNSPEGRMAMRGNFWGVLGEHYARAYGRVGDGEILSGIPGSPTNHHAAPYAMTEEFTAVYRMHSLLPDAFSFRRHQDGGEVAACDFMAVAGGGVRDLYGRVPYDDVLYSLATSNPGALVLHNYPNGLRKLHKKDAIFLDIAATDVLRDRERGVPRYCDFRRHLGMRVPKSFADLTSNPEWQRELAAIYKSVEQVDLLVGLHCETPPPGFGFSDTAFRIFILMASRRLKSDRFFTADFTPKVYTPAGFAWIQDNNMRSVLERHVPHMRPHFANVRNVFFPWDK
ncbi:MAG TPA: peroxidase family protein, partial [Xanthobacteraceae bacterium]|nr:peroxidase family protein [Xanthobacteraceae bacterium]